MCDMTHSYVTWLYIDKCRRTYADIRLYLYTYVYICIQPDATNRSHRICVFWLMQTYAYIYIQAMAFGVCVYIHECVYIHMSVCIHTWVCAYIHECVYTYMSVCMHTYPSISCSILNLIGLFSTERGKRDLENKIYDGDLRMKNSDSKCNRPFINSIV